MSSAFSGAAPSSLTESHRGRSSARRLSTAIEPGGPRTWERVEVVSYCAPMERSCVFRVSNRWASKATEKLARWRGKVGSPGAKRRTHQANDRDLFDAPVGPRRCSKVRRKRAQLERIGPMKSDLDALLRWSAGFALQVEGGGVSARDLKCAEQVTLIGRRRESHHTAGDMLIAGCRE